MKKRVWVEVAPSWLMVGISVLTLPPMVAIELVRPAGLMKAMLNGTLVVLPC